jgi:putative acetyltransferase
LPEPYTPPGGIIFLARVNGNLAGCIALRSINSQKGELKRLYVRSEYRGIGSGKQLIEAMIHTARKAGYHKLYLDTLPGLQTAQKLFSNLGFVSTESFHSNDTQEQFFMCWIFYQIKFSYDLIQIFS